MAYNQIAKRDNQDITALTRKTAESVKAQLIKNKSAILATLPVGFNYDRMCRTVIYAISTTPLLAKCSTASIVLSSIRAFSLGLEPNGPLNEGYLVPFWNSRKGFYEAQFMPSYRGLQNLSRRSGEILDIYAKAVYSNDEFDVEEGTDRKIHHKPDYTKDRGTATCYYAVFHTVNGGKDFEVMSLCEIESIHKRSKSEKSEREGKETPWTTDYDEMAKKTVLKRLLKRAPMSIELSGAINLENKVSMGEEIDDILDIDGIDVSDAETTAEIQTAVNAERAEEVKAKIEKAKTEKQPELTPSQMDEPPESFFENK